MTKRTNLRRTNLRRTNLLGAAALCALVALAVGCATATTFQMTPDPSTPAAEGQVSVKAESNNNLSLKVKVAHLPPPENLAGNLNTFVVWLQPSGTDKLVNLGALGIGSGRSGKLSTTTPYRDFTLYVTAEASGQVSKPSDHLVLRRELTYTSS